MNNANYYIECGSPYHEKYSTKISDSLQFIFFFFFELFSFLVSHQTSIDNVGGSDCVCSVYYRVFLQFHELFGGNVAGASQGQTETKLFAVDQGKLSALACCAVGQFYVCSNSSCGFVCEWCVGRLEHLVVLHERKRQAIERKE